MALLKNEQRMHWYVMRDLKRPNAKLPAYKQLSDEHLEVFTPMQWRLKLKNGKRIREEVPFMQDLLFIHELQPEMVGIGPFIPQKDTPFRAQAPAP